MCPIVANAKRPRLWYCILGLERGWEQVLKAGLERDLERNRELGPEHCLERERDLAKVYRGASARLVAWGPSVSTYTLLSIPIYLTSGKLTFSRVLKYVGN